MVNKVKCLDVSRHPIIKVQIIFCLPLNEFTVFFD